MKRFLTTIIRFYQLTLSALIGRNCRYLPSCSEYTIEAIEKHGSWRGLKLGLARIARCHPWGGHGFDPVPDHICGSDHDPNASQKKREPDKAP